MSTKGIIFSASMVRALLAGTKTQTRRLLRNPEYFGCPTGDCPHNTQAECNAAMAALTPKEANGYAAGDRLYVRECIHKNTDPLCYRADMPSEDPEGPWCPSIHMPRWASRLWLDVTEVRVQRLQDISGNDARQEGIERADEWPHWRDYEGRFPHMLTARESFQTLWSSLHAKPGERWEDNPWIVAVSFTVHHGNIDQQEGGL